MGTLQPMCASDWVGYMHDDISGASVRGQHATIFTLCIHFLTCFLKLWSTYLIIET